MTDPREAITFAPASHDDRVAVLEERSHLAIAKPNRILAAGSQLDQRTFLAVSRTRQCAGSEQIAGAQHASIDRVVSDHLRHRPIRVAVAGRSKYLGMLPALLHL